MSALFGLAACGLWRDTARDWLPERDGAGQQVQDQILGPGNESGGPFPIPRSFFFLLLSHANQPLPHATQGTLDLTKGTMEGVISQREERGAEEERVVSCGGFSLQCGALGGDAKVALLMFFFLTDLLCTFPDPVAMLFLPQSEKCHRAWALNAQSRFFFVLLVLRAGPERKESFLPCLCERSGWKRNRVSFFCCSFCLRVLWIAEMRKYSALSALPLSPCAVLLTRKQPFCCWEEKSFLFSCCPCARQVHNPRSFCPACPFLPILCSLFARPHR